MAIKAVISRIARVGEQEPSPPQSKSNQQKPRKGGDTPLGEQEPSPPQPKSNQQKPRKGGDTPPKLKPTTEWRLPKEAVEKVPKDWAPVKAANKKTGLRWADPKQPKANTIRIDRGNPDLQNPSQQVDHVQVVKGGKVIGRDGNAIQGSVQDNWDQAHIPVSEWLKWSTWYAP